MKKIVIILLSIMSQICSAQEYKKINPSGLIYERIGMSDYNSLVITNKDKSKLSKGFYEMMTNGNLVQFYINAKGNVDGVFKEYDFKGSLRCKRILKEGVQERIVSLDSTGKITDSLQLGIKNVKVYNSTLKKWKPKPLRVYASYSFYKNGIVFKEAYNSKGLDVKVYLYYQDGTMMSDEIYFYYRKEFDISGVLTKQIDYNWQTKETQTLNYKNGKLVLKAVVFDEDEIWEPNGTIIRNSKVHESNHISKSYTTVTEYSPSGKTHQYTSKGEGYKEDTKGGIELYGRVMVADYREENEDLENKIYIGAEIEMKPEYPNGIDAFYKFFYHNFIMPKEEGLKGKIYLSFIVEKDGSLSDIKVIRDIGYGTGLEAMRVLGKSQKWISGEKNGKKVRCRYSTVFSLPSE